MESAAGSSISKSPELAIEYSRTYFTPHTVNLAEVAKTGISTETLITRFVAVRQNDVASAFRNTTS
jgi:hypothetical protein